MISNLFRPEDVAGQPRQSLVAVLLQPLNPRLWLGVLSKETWSPQAACWFSRKSWLLPGSFPVLTIVVVVFVGVCAGLGSEGSSHARLLN